MNQTRNEPFHHLDWLNHHGWMNAAGTGGYIPDWQLLEIFPKFELFVTNPISYFPRTPSRSPRMIDSAGGMIVHTGLPNPGFERIIKKYTGRWKNSKLPIVPHLMLEDPETIFKMVRRIESLENIYAIELGSSGYTEKSVIVEGLNAAIGELPIIFNMPFDLVHADFLLDFISLGISAVSIQVPRGIIQTREKYLRGRMYGPGIFPLTMHAVQIAKYCGVPILAGAGIMNEQQVQQLFDIGAYGVQLHELVWRGW